MINPTVSQQHEEMIKSISQQRGQMMKSFIETNMIPSTFKRQLLPWIFLMEETMTIRYIQHDQVPLVLQELTQVSMIQELKLPIPSQPRTDMVIRIGYMQSFIPSEFVTQYAKNLYHKYANLNLHVPMYAMYVIPHETKHLVTVVQPDCMSLEQWFYNNKNKMNTSTTNTTFAHYLEQMETIMWTLLEHNLQMFVFSPSNLFLFSSMSSENILPPKEIITMKLGNCILIKPISYLMDEERKTSMFWLMKYISLMMMLRLLKITDGMYDHLLHEYILPMEKDNEQRNQVHALYHHDDFVSNKSMIESICSMFHIYLHLQPDPEGYDPSQYHYADHPEERMAKQQKEDQHKQIRHAFLQNVQAKKQLQQEAVRAKQQEEDAQFHREQLQRAKDFNQDVNLPRHSRSQPNHSSQQDDVTLFDVIGEDEQHMRKKNKNLHHSDVDREILDNMDF